MRGHNVGTRNYQLKERLQNDRSQSGYYQLKERFRMRGHKVGTTSFKEVSE